MLVRMQRGIERLKGGASAYVYAVTEDIVLKSPVTFIAPQSDEYYIFAMETVCLHDDMEAERGIFRQLANKPHPNIIEAISIEFEEGIYLRRHQPLLELLRNGRPSHDTRVFWYQDIARGLLHLHSLQIAHADLRLDNLLYDNDHRIILCDFNCARAFGEPNPSTKPSVNGDSETVSDMTDRFALASVMYELETGHEAESTVFERLAHPSRSTGSLKLDSIILNAWRGNYESTYAILDDLLAIEQAAQTRQSLLRRPSLQELNDQILRWRNLRKRSYGKRDI